MGDPKPPPPPPDPGDSCNCTVNHYFERRPSGNCPQHGAA
jgi:hypothetical protein